jgi:hypothetical protein
MADDKEKDKEKEEKELKLEIGEPKELPPEHVVADTGPLRFLTPEETAAPPSDALASAPPAAIAAPPPPAMPPPGPMAPSVAPPPAAAPATPPGDQELLDAMAAQQQLRKDNYGQNFFQRFAANLADPSGKLLEKKKAEAEQTSPLAQLLERRKLLSAAQDERVKRETEQRQRDLFDKNSAATKNSALLLKAMGVTGLPEEYTASQFKDYEDLARLQNEANQLKDSALYHQEEGKRGWAQIKATIDARKDALAERQAEHEEKTAANAALAGLQTKGYEKAARAKKEIADVLADKNMSLTTKLGRLNQLTNELAVAGVQARQKPLAPVRPNGVKEELELIPGPGRILADPETAQKLLESYTGDIGAAAGVDEGKPPPNGQQTVHQGGFTYNWNPTTGKYE